LAKEKKRKKNNEGKDPDKAMTKSQNQQRAGISPHRKSGEKMSKETGKGKKKSFWSPKTARRVPQRTRAGGQ